MNQISLIILLLISINLFSQEDEFDKYQMVKATKLSIRAEPNLNSKKLGMVEKGKLVKIINRRMEDRYMATVDGIQDSWAEIEFEGIKGFMFGGYLTDEIINMPNENWKGNYLLLLEGNQGGVIFSAELNWYGIYLKKDGEYIEKINIKLESVVSG